MKVNKEFVRHSLIEGFKTLLAIFVCIYAVMTLLRVANSDSTEVISPSPSSQPNITCTRTSPYQLLPEFERARSLRKQRIEEYLGTQMDYSFYNCINIEYADLSSKSAEGMFYFDKDSSLDNLKIFVDRSYKMKDDLLTAILLQHEFAHVGQFINQINKRVKLSCFDGEIDAFVQQVNFLKTLNQEEVNSLVQKLFYYREGGYRGSVSEGIVAQVDYLLAIKIKSINSCKAKYDTGSEDYENCYFDAERAAIEKMVKDSPGYQEQCKGEL